MAETAGPLLSSYPSFKRSLRSGLFRSLYSSVRDKTEKIVELIGSAKLKELDERWANYFAKGDTYLEQIHEYHAEQIKIFTDAIAEREHSSSSQEKEVDLDLDLDLDLELSKYPIFEATLRPGRYPASMLSRDTAKKGMRFVGSSKIAELDERWRKLNRKIVEQVNQEMNPLILEQYKTFADALARLASSSNN